MQYRSGTVSVTGGSNAVTGSGTLWLGNVEPGHVFSLLRSGVSYVVASVESDTRLILSSPYGGDDKTDAAYTVTRDFTPYYGLPYPDYGDVDTATLWKQMALRIEQAIVEQDTGLTVIESRAITVPPPAPDGRVNYIVPAGATGAWAGQADRIAVWDNGVWKFIQAKEGWRVYVRDESYIDYVYDSPAGVPGWHPGQQVGAAVAAAIAARDEAQAWAEKDGPVKPGAYSARYYAHDAAVSLAGINAQLADAIAARIAADAARQAAEQARDAARQARDDAVLAEADAEDDAVAADTARLAAEQARDGAIEAKADAQLAETGAGVAQIASEAASQRAEDWAVKLSAAVDGVEWSAKHYAQLASGYTVTVTAAKLAAETAAQTASQKAAEATTALATVNNQVAVAVNKATEAAASSASANQSAIDALAAKGDAINARDLTYIARDLAQQYRGQAQAYAENAQGQQVEPGLYSAKHYALLSQGFMNQAALIVGGNNFAIIGDGTAQRLTATSPGELFHLVGGYGMQLLFNAGTKSVTFAVAADGVEHQKLSGAGTCTHAQIDGHIADASAHLPAGGGSRDVLLSVGGSVAAWSRVSFADLDDVPDIVTADRLGAADGVATLGADGKALPAQLGRGVHTGDTVLRGDGSWGPPPAVPVRTPTITSPANGSGDVALRPTITMNGFASGWGMGHAATQFLLVLESDPSVVAADSGELGAVTGWTVPPGFSLAKNTTYRVRGRYKDAEGAWSAWSPDAIFTTIDLNVATPSVASPLDGATNISLRPTLTSSAFAMATGPGTHGASQWQIATDPGFVSVVADTGETDTLLTAFDPPTLLLATTYHARVRHKSDDGLWSAWSPAVSFTTVMDINLFLATGAADAPSAWNGVDVGPDGSAYVCGNFPGSPGAVAKISPEGAVHWIKYITVSGLNMYTLWKLCVSQDGARVYVVGVAATTLPKQYIVTLSAGDGAALGSAAIGDGALSAVIANGDGTVTTVGSAFDAAAGGLASITLANWGMNLALNWKRHLSVNASQGRRVYSSGISGLSVSGTYIDLAYKEMATIGGYSASGDYWRWIKSLDLGPKSSFRSVVETPNGTLVAVGDVVLDGVRQGLVAKYDVNGNLLWHRVFSAPSVNPFGFSSVTVASGSNGPYFVGTANGVLKIGEDGSLIEGWSLNSASVTDIKVTATKIYVVGSVRSVLHSNGSALLLTWPRAEALAAEGVLPGLPGPFSIDATTAVAITGTVTEVGPGVDFVVADATPTVVASEAADGVVTNTCTFF